MSLFNQVDLERASDPVPGTLVLHSMPGRFEPMGDFLTQAEAVGVQQILCLTGRAEIEEKSPEYGKWLDRRDKEKQPNISEIPISDYSVPGDFDHFAKTISSLSKTLRSGGVVLIHCAAGVGRTGTSAVCLLGMLGFDQKESLERVYEAHAEPENDAQIAFIEKLFAVIDNESIKE